jgi:predicted nucleic acid-binding protein
MIIIDTSIWVEFFRGNQPYFDQVSELLVNGDAVALSPVFGELLQGAKNDAERSTIVSFWNTLPRLSEFELFIRAGLDSGRNKLTDRGVGIIDSVILTAARENASFVWSLDKKLLSLLKREEIYIPDSI